jgi:hypothetical protein
MKEQLNWLMENWERIVLILGGIGGVFISVSKTVSKKLIEIDKVNRRCELIGLINLLNDGDDLTLLIDKYAKYSSKGYNNLNELKNIIHKKFKNIVI